jgi:hypothetical protein
MGLVVRCSAGPWRVVKGAHGLCLSEMRGYQLDDGGERRPLKPEGSGLEAAKATKRSGGQAHAWQGPHWLEIRGASRWESTVSNNAKGR